jgi:signal transduction histidine kinase
MASVAVDNPIAADDSSVPTPGPDGSAGFQDYLQTIVEAEKADFVRELHDELGGLLVGAIMDLAWVDQSWKSCAGMPTKSYEKITRARQSLATAVDLKRKLVEKLRPSLLENVGLFAALRWHITASCQKMGFECRVDLPEKELALLPKASIVLFRMIQEVYAIFCDVPGGSADLTAVTKQDRLEIEIRVAQITVPKTFTGARGFALLAVRQRMSFLGGETELRHPSDSSTIFRATVPLRNISAGDQTPVALQ